MNLENTQVQMRKGILEYCILHIISRGEVYASDMLDELTAAKIIVVEGTLYPLLTRLKNAGLLEYKWIESKSGPPRKYYKLTDKGSKFLGKLTETWDELVHSTANDYDQIKRITPTTYIHMKKNISINISGIIFHIEEDGYENLRKYLDSINKYFSSFEDSSEIMADIESRIAEIFLSKLNEGKQVITAEDVNSLITTMGSVSDFKAAEDQEFSQGEHSESFNRIVLQHFIIVNIVWVLVSVYKYKHSKRNWPDYLSTTRSNYAVISREKSWVALCRPRKLFQHRLRMDEIVFRHARLSPMESVS